MVSIAKIQKVEKLSNELNSASMIIVVHYHGITVSEIETMRKNFRNNGVSFQIIKNRLMKIAIDGSEFSVGEALFSGPSAIAYSSDPISVAKSVIESVKQNTKLKLIGGIFESEVINADKIRLLASLPSKDEVRAQLLRVISAPATKLVRVINEPATSLVRVTKAKIDAE